MVYRQTWRPERVSKQWFVVKLASPTGLAVLQNGGQNKEDIYVRRQAFEIFNAVANTDKSQRNMIFLITIKNLVFDYQMYFMAYMLKKDEYNLSLKDDKIDTLTYEITTLVTENKQQSYEIQKQSYDLSALASDFKLLMKRTQNIDETLRHEIGLHEQTHQLLDEVKNELSDVKNELDTQTDHLNVVIDAVEQVMDHIVPGIKEQLMTDHFVVLHNRDDLDHYYIIRSQKRALTASIRSIRKEYPAMYVLVDEIDYTHPKNLFILFKQYLIEHKNDNIFVTHNHVHVFDTYITRSTVPTDHKLIHVFETVKSTIVQPLQDTIEHVRV
uniref:DUF3627 domain-containing protein n=1 Tax=viral metagenome TaxID=1070528 RepID=A0A6C0CTJ1_9ZZZZ